ncbi:MAG: dihydropteroate synthase [Deltaproteobacteria bacterium]|nr:MAG: dihydropteroate synthase [Deltaproteobacteria bacterium]
MIVIGERINVMTKVLGNAMKTRDKKPIQDMAIKETEAGADYLDLNLGPARKGGPELMQWVVETVQEVSDLPLFLDTTNVEAIEAGLQVASHDHGKPVINSISCRPERMDALLPLAKKYDAGFVALLLGVDGIPRDASERGVLAAEIFHKATAEYGIGEEDIWFDPIVLPINVQLQQVQACFEFTEQIPYMAPNGKSTCGVSNVSNGSPNHLRPILNQTYMIMLQKQGMYSCIMDPLDEGMMEFARGGRQDIVKLIYRMLDGEDVNPDDLSEEELKYYKTVRVLRGDILYSDSWLEV